MVLTTNRKDESGSRYLLTLDQCILGKDDSPRINTDRYPLQADVMDHDRDHSTLCVAFVLYRILIVY